MCGTQFYQTNIYPFFLFLSLLLASFAGADQDLNEKSIISQPPAKIKKIAVFSKSLRQLGLPTAWMDELPPSAIQRILFDSNPRTQPEFHPNTRGALATAIDGPKTRLTLPKAFEDISNPGSIAPAFQLSEKDIATILHELWHSYWNWLKTLPRCEAPNQPHRLQTAALETIALILNQVEWTQKNQKSASQGEIIFDEAVAEYLQALTMDMVSFQKERLASGNKLSAYVESIFINRWNATRAGPQLGYSLGESRTTGKVNLPMQIRSIVELMLGIPENILNLPLPQEDDRE